MQGIVYGVEQAGRVLEQFIKGVDTVDTNIGEHREPMPYEKGNNGYVVTGLEIMDSDAPINILLPDDVEIETNNHFLVYQGKNAEQILEEYLGGTVGLASLNSLETLRSIMSHKKVLMPFKPTKDSEIISKNNKDKAKVFSVTWHIDPITKEFQGVVNFAIKSEGRLVPRGQGRRIPFSGYGKDFRMLLIEKGIDNDDIDREVIQMTRFGYIQPIEIYDGKVTLAIDGYHVYLIVDELPIIVGNLDSKEGLIELDELRSIHRYRAYKYMKKNVNYILKHIRYIAPYKLANATQINL